MKTLQVSPAAARDLLAISNMLQIESGSSRLGNRFLRAAASTFEVIRVYPSAGRIRPTLQVQLSKLRSLRVDSPFGKYLTFYQALAEGTFILRVLHGAQDLGYAVNIDTERDA